MADAVEAAESAVTWTERRLRLERSLHDGAQQHLLAIQIALVEASLPESDTRWSEVASTLRRQLVGAIDEIRSLADGNPPLQFVAGDVVGSILRLGAASPLRVVADLPDSVRPRGGSDTSTSCVPRPCTTPRCRAPQRRPRLLCASGRMWWP